MLILDIRAVPATNSIGTYFDSCVFLIMFILLGRTLEALAKSRTTDAVSLLGSLRPESALLIDSQATEQEETLTQLEDLDSTLGRSNIASPRRVPVNHLERGDLVLCQPGSLPSADGIIVSGTAMFDESSLTGESRPVKKGPGEEVFTGTINKSSAITVRVTGLASETMLERIIAAVSDASARKAPIEKLAERLTGVFVPIIIYLALIDLAIWLGIALSGVLSKEDADSPGGRFFFAIEFAISTLVVACPCGIGLAVPCANAVGNGIAARAGILASGGGQAFLAATKVTTIAFDKTGTLTIGRSVVTDEEHFGGPVDQSILKSVQAVEGQSTHPLAIGLVDHLKSKSVNSIEPVDIIHNDEIAGRGMRSCATVGTHQLDLLIGNASLMYENGIRLDEIQEGLIAKWCSEAKSVILVAARRQSETSYTLPAMFSLSDPPRETTSTLLARLKHKGYKLVMLSGDNEKTAQAVGRMVEIDEKDVRAGVGPKEKADVIRELKATAGLHDEVGVKKRRREWMARSGKNQVNKVMFVGGQST